MAAHIRWKRVGIAALVSIGIAMFGVIPGMGLPGVFVLGLPDLFYDAIFGPWYKGFFMLAEGDSYQWPAAIFATLVWPPSIFFGYVLAFEVGRSLPTWSKWMLFLGIMIMWAMAITLYLYQAVVASLS